EDRCMPTPAVAMAAASKPTKATAACSLKRPLRGQNASISTPMTATPTTIIIGASSEYSRSGVGIGVFDCKSMRFISPVVISPAPQDQFVHYQMRQYRLAQYAATVRSALSGTWPNPLPD